MINLEKIIFTINLVNHLNNFLFVLHSNPPFAKTHPKFLFLYYPTGIAQLQEYLEHMFSLYPVFLHVDVVLKQLSFFVDLKI